MQVQQLASVSHSRLPGGPGPGLRDRLGTQRRLGRVDELEIGPDVQLSGGDEQPDDRGRGQVPRVRETAQLPEQVSTLTGEHAGHRGGIAALAVPAAVGLALAAGAVPAWLAARADPVASVRPPVLAVRRAHHPHEITGLALVNVLRTPGRTLAGALTLAVGTTALTLIIAVVLAFRGTVVGSLLGNAVAVQVRGPDYVAAAATLVLGVLAVTDVLFINIRERAAELATMRALGWSDRTLARLVITEGTLIGLAGSTAGTALGLAGAAMFAGQLPARLLVAGLAAVVIGTAVTVAAATLPAQLLRRLPAALLLAEE